MTPYTELQRRIRDEMDTYAPTLAAVLANHRATDAWLGCPRRDPNHVEAAGLRDVLALRQMFQQLYWRNTRADG